MCVSVYLYVDVIVFPLGDLNEDGKHRQNRLCAEERTLRPNNQHRQH